MVVTLSSVDDDVNSETLVELCSESGLPEALNLDGRAFEDTASGVMRLNLFLEVFGFESSTREPPVRLETAGICNFVAGVAGFGSAMILGFVDEAAVDFFGMPDPGIGKLDRLFAIANVCSVS